MAVYSSNTAPEDKDCWQTPQWLFEALTLEFGFWLDAAANEQNALCPYFLTIRNRMHYKVIGKSWRHMV
ncbi:hypothetical protein AAY77_15710 [Providencia rettgeri]|nr:hypothetical protein AAY77_15710 [Providencia rettgeri]